MRVSARLAVLERHFAERKKQAEDPNPPPERELYLLENGSFDRQKYYAACNEWCVAETGKTIHELAEEIAEVEDF